MRIGRRCGNVNKILENSEAPDLKAQDIWQQLVIGDTSLKNIFYVFSL